MRESYLDKSLDYISNFSNRATDKYDNHIKQKAIKEVDNRLKEKNLIVDDINRDDYEAMVSEVITEIKKDYSSSVAKVGFSLLGLDLIFG